MNVFDVAKALRKQGIKHRYISNKDDARVYHSKSNNKNIFCFAYSPMSVDIVIMYDQLGFECLFNICAGSNLMIKIMKEFDYNFEKLQSNIYIESIELFASNHVIYFNDKIVVSASNNHIHKLNNYFGKIYINKIIDNNLSKNIMCKLPNLNCNKLYFLTFPNNIKHINLINNFKINTLILDSHIISNHYHELFKHIAVENLEIDDNLIRDKTSSIIMNESIKSINLIVHHDSNYNFDFIRINQHISFNIKNICNDATDDFLNLIKKFLTFDNILFVKHKHYAKFDKNILKIKNELDELILSNKINFIFSDLRFKIYKTLQQYLKI